MADDVRVTNLPDPGSKEAVALGLTKLALSVMGGFNSKEEMLNVYVDCLEATWGNRPKT